MTLYTLWDISVNTAMRGSRVGSPFNTGLEAVIVVLVPIHTLKSPELISVSSFKHPLAFCHDAHRPPPSTFAIRTYRLAVRRASDFI